MELNLLTNEGINESIARDPNNLCNGRNQHNTPVAAYNCGGFALKTFNWLTPYTDEVEDDDDPYTEADREEYMQELFDYGGNTEYVEDRVTRADIDQILHRFKFLQQVRLEDTVPEDTIIAYRILIKYDENDEIIEDTDFHFKVRLGGFWFEKTGGGDIHLCQLDNDKPWVYESVDLCYTGPIYFLRDNRKKT